MKLRGIKTLTKAYRLLRTNPEVAKNLGFCSLPTYETIRHFANDLLTAKVLKAIFYAEVGEIKAKLNGDLGKVTIEDATVITAKAKDPEAEYNGYYDDRGWKKDLVIDQPTGVFLSFSDLGINDNEADCLVGHLGELEKIGIHVGKNIVDGKYPTYENIAMAKHGYRTDLLYSPQEHWVHNPKGEPEEIERMYQKYWQEEDFSPEASIGYKLRFLFDRGEYEAVGAYYRNKVMEDGQDEDYGQREKIESANGYLKSQMGFEALPRKGSRAAFRHTTLCLIAINAVALTRLQHGVREALTSVAYLT
jgi:hypothetical protein